FFFYKQKIKCAEKCCVLPLQFKGTHLQCEYSKEQRRKFFRYLKFKEGTDSIVKEEGCTINEIMLEN
ncbi:hypothetical protein Gotur_035675, partial [Gossypium turneri]